MSPAALRTGRTLIAVGVVALIAALTATAVAWRLVDDGTATVTASLDVTSDAVTTLDATVELSLETLTVAGSGLSALESTLNGAEPTLDRIAGIVDGVGGMAAGEVPDGLDEISAVLGAVTTAADTINTAIDGLAQLGLGVSAGPGIGESLAVVEDQLAAISATLRVEGTNLSQVAADFRSLGADASELSGDLAEVVDNVDRAGDLLASYDATTSDAIRLMGETRTDLDRWSDEARLLVVLLGVVLTAAALTPLLLGRQMIGRAGSSTSVESPSTPTTPVEPEPSTLEVRDPSSRGPGRSATEQLRHHR